MVELLPVFEASLTTKGERRLRALRRREDWPMEDVSKEDIVDAAILNMVELQGILPIEMTGEQILDYLENGYIELVGQLDVEDLEYMRGRF